MKEGFPIRLLIVALPAGLFLSGILAVLNTHLNQNEEKGDPNELIRLEAAAVNRRPINHEDLANSLEILNARIGERHPLLPEKLESAAAWIESTLGPANIGYLVEREALEAGEVQVRNLIAELPGRKQRDDIIVIGAHYDTAPGGSKVENNGSGVAALLALARAYAGDQQTRTIRFLIFANGASPYLRTEEMGSLVYAKACRARGEKIVAVINLILSEESTEAKAIVSFVGTDDSRYLVDSLSTVFRRATGIPASSKIIPPDRMETGAPYFWPVRQAGYPTVLVTGTANQAAEKIDLNKLVTVTQGLKTVIDTLANP